MHGSPRALLARLRRVPPSRVADAVARKARKALRNLAAVSRARLWGTTISPRGLRAALRHEAGGLAGLHPGDDPFSPSGFLLDTDTQDRMVATIRQEHPKAIPATLSAVEAIVAHRFDLLGSGPTPLGEEIDWHRDFKSGYRWDPRAFYTQVRYGRVQGVDVKVPWELSRFQHLATLGKAFWFTGEGRYAHEFVDQVSHWMARNPPQFGVNWSCTMDVAIRAFNWLWGYAFFRQASELTPAFRRAFVGGLLAHGRHILSNLERGSDDINSNHYIANLAGLAGLGLACPGFREAARWREVALCEAFREIERQVHPDGGDFESSIPYHRLVAEMFLAVALLCRRNTIDLPAPFCKRLEAMLDFTRCYTKPNGLAPQIGDADSGRLHILSGYGRWDPRDHRHMLAVGGFLLGRDDLLAAAGPQTEEAIWLSNGAWPPRRLDPAPEPGSRAFPDSGIYVMRQEGFYLLVTCGAVGTGGIGNHKHNDLLSFELHADGQDLFVDPGSYLYTPEPALRDQFRSTAAHNTVMIDDAEQNRFGEGGLFWLHVDATPRGLDWQIGPEEDVFVGEHDGYTRLSHPVIHRREFRVDKRARVVEILDRFQGTGDHVFAWNFTAAPGLRVRAAGEGTWEITGPMIRAQLTLEGFEPALPPTRVHSELAQIFVSPAYGVREESTAIRVRLRAVAPLVCRYRIRVS